MIDLTKEVDCENVYETNSMSSISCLQTGVPASSIAVQSPYMAQVQLLCDRIEEIPGAEGVEVASVDSFQGREANAVVISMVFLFTLATDEMTLICF